MALGDSSPFAPVDLLGGLVTNVVATNFACKNHSFRTGIAMKNKSGVEEVPAYLDFRFLGGVAAAVAGQLIPNPMARRVGHDLASGLLNSYVATETCRRHALQRVSDTEWQSEDGPLHPSQMKQQLAEPAAAAPAQAQPEKGAQNYAYGW
jgi:hypothetical protein